MKYLFYFISFIFPALCSSAQPAERDSSIYIASSRLYRMGESLVVSMQVDITRQIPSNESVILIPRLSDSLDNFIQLPAIYVNGRKQHIFFQRETGRQEKDYEELRRRNDRKQSVHYLRSIPLHPLDEACLLASHRKRMRMRSSPPYRLHLSDPPEHPSRYPSARSVHHSADGRKESARRKRTCLSGLPAQRNNRLSRIQKQSGRTGKDKAQYRPDKKRYQCSHFAY